MKTKSRKAFYERSVFTLVGDCVAEVRRYLLERYPCSMGQGSGVIRFDFQAEVGRDLFAKWLRIPANTPEELIPSSTHFVYPLMPGWTTTTWVEHSDWQYGPMDCAAVAGMKVACCEARRKHGIRFTSGQMPTYLKSGIGNILEFGYSESKGCIVFVLTEKGSGVCLGAIYVTVSCGSCLTQEEEDDLARFTAPIIEKFFEDDPKAEILPESRHSIAVFSS